MRAFVYSRISEDRTGAGLGVARQEKECREVATKLGWEVVATFTDNDISAYSGKPRPGYRAMLERLDAGEASAVLCWHTDRLHRSPVELEEYVEVCDRVGVVTQSVKSGPLDLATPSGRLVARQLGAVARFEVEHQIERAKAKRQEKVAAGQWPGGRRPYGFEGDGTTHRADEAEIIRWATREVIAGRALGSLAAELNTAGKPTTTGRPWDATAIRRVLLRPRNAGHMVHRGEIVGPAQWEPVVDPELWVACRAVLEDPNRRSNHRGPARQYVGGGLYLCGVCGAPMKTVIHTQGRAYECSAERNGTDHVRRDGDHLDDYVSAVVIERLSRPDLADLLTTEDEDTSGLHVEAQGIRERLDEAARLYAAGSITGAQLTTTTAALKERAEDIDRRLSASAERSTLARFATRDPGEVWGDLDVEQKRAVIDLLMVVYVDPAPRGRPKGWKPGEPYFHPESVRIEWKS